MKYNHFTLATILLFLAFSATSQDALSTKDLNKLNQFYKNELKINIKKYKKIEKKQEKLLSKLDLKDTCYNTDSLVVLAPLFKAPMNDTCKRIAAYMDTLLINKKTKNLKEKLQEQYAKINNNTKAIESLSKQNKLSKKAIESINKYSQKTKLLNALMTNKNPIDKQLLNKIPKVSENPYLNKSTAELKRMGYQFKNKNQEKMMQIIDSSNQLGHKIIEENETQDPSQELSVFEQEIEKYKQLFTFNKYKFYPIAYRMKPVFNINTLPSKTGFNINLGLGIETQANNVLSLGITVNSGFNINTKYPKYAFSYQYSELNAYLNLTLPFEFIFQNGIAYQFNSTRYNTESNHISANQVYAFSSIGREININSKTSLRILLRYKYLGHFENPFEFVMTIN